MWYALCTVFRQPGRYIPAILTVGMVGSLLLAQLSLVFSAIKYVTLPIATANADLWVCYGDPPSFENPEQMPRLWEARVASQPGVFRTELQLMGGAQLKRRNGQTETCIIVGTEMTDDSIATMNIVPSSLRKQLANPGAFACYESDLPTLELSAGDLCEISDQSVYFAGSVRGKQYTVPYLLCSIETCERVLPLVGNSRTSYILATIDPKCDAQQIAKSINRDYPELSAYTREQMVHKIRLFILTESKTGLVILCVTIFAATISIFVTSQTLYAETIALKNEIAVLDALGISLNRLSMFVVFQALVIGSFAGLISLAIGYMVNALMSDAGLPMEMNPGVYAISSALTAMTILLSALIAQRSLRHIEPAELLH